MYFHYQRSYRGPVQAVILDWAGTTVDFGSLAPVVADQRRERAHQRLLAGGAHYAIDSIVDLPRYLDAIEARLARGERP